jgi:hypothetical protein
MRKDFENVAYEKRFLLIGGKLFLIFFQYSYKGGRMG